MPGVLWDSEASMPAWRDFEAYHFFDEAWNHFVFHSHAYWEIYMFIHGSVRIMLEERLYEVQPWDMIVFPPGAMHKNIPVGKNENYDRAVFYVTDSFLRSAGTAACDLAQMLGSVVKKKQYLFHLSEETGRIILSSIEEMYRRSEDSSALSQLINHSRMIILLATVCENIHISAADAVSDFSSKASPILHYLNQHFTEVISLDALAARFYTSKYHLLREFKEYTGTTIHQYLIHKRVVYAQLLLQRGLKPTQAASACGFLDYAGFFRAFRRITGVSPLDYVRTVL